MGRKTTQNKIDLSNMSKWFGTRLSIVGKMPMVSVNEIPQIKNPWKALN